ncbi:sacsin N-terminal ATP-binding-like domain-containing protein [Pseudomonas sp. 52 E 6]|uniref:sacsin N-terminal ATP-binding-like domain-containing protein n=1 Tax=Pseudomonas sp. 52 E 6 TaxID=1844106 RepID=UPI000811E157|nr:DUF3883 domain-containing protein [Pseudomonas sp. 52 E 6]CRM63810.1 hypothetical protein [Pseudomonas sp. 52 E 6]
MSKYEAPSRSVETRREIESKTRAEIEAYLASRGKTRVHESARNLSLNVSDDYGNRFLVELIQNAHDAHPHGHNDGEVAVVFSPDELPHGCLYVANRGNGFRAGNFESITQIALSSKSVNESIGNKGLGFRSVLQICHWPQVYSVSDSAGGNNFDGYCFRFAEQSDIETILKETGEDPVLAGEILRNMPCWFLPVVAEDRPGLIQRFASEGFASVVRMPLDSAQARASVLDQVEWLCTLQTPLHLFLERLARITIEREPGQVHTLSRTVRQSWQRDHLDIQRVAVGDKQEFLFLGADLDAVEFRQQLDDSVGKGELPAKWQDWQGAARITVVVRLDASVEQGLLYCFLPLGAEALAPFAGYINANFYTKMDRRSINGSIGLNQYFIQSAAKLVRPGIEFLIEQDWPTSPGAVIDLMCWREPYAEIIRRTFSESDSSFLEQPILPVSAAGGARWAPAISTHLWDTAPGAMFSSEAIVSATLTDIFTSSVTTLQRDAFVAFFDQIDKDFDPTPETMAQWVEAVALRLHEKNVSIETWALFYDEVAISLKESPSALFDKRFLLGQDGELIASSQIKSKRRTRTTDIYFPPAARVGAEDESDGEHAPLTRLPKKLHEWFAFVSPQIPWLTKDGYRPAHTFLVNGKLVREYDTRGVMRTLAGITSSQAAHSTKMAALEAALRFWLISTPEIGELKFFLPARQGWVPASEAMFGNGWSSSNGNQMVFVTPKDAWHFSSDDDHQKPRFMPLVARPIAKLLNEGYTERMRAAGLGILNDPDDAERALQVYVAAAEQDIAESRDVRRFKELFSEAWNEVARRGRYPEIKVIPVSSGGRISTVPVTLDASLEASAQPVYFIDEEDSAKTRLLEELGHPLFEFDIKDRQGAWTHLQTRAPGRFIRLSEQTLEVHIDGIPIDEVQSLPLLPDLYGAWLVEYILCAAESKGGWLFRRTPQNFARLRQNISSLRFLVGQRISVSMGGQLRALPVGLRGALTTRIGNQVILVAQSVRSPDFSLLAEIHEQLAAALNQPGLAAGLEAAFLRLMMRLPDGEVVPSNDEIADILGMEVSSVHAVRRMSQADLSAQIRFVHVLAVLHSQDEVSQQLVELLERDDVGEEVLLECCNDLAAIFGVAPRELLTHLSQIADFRGLQSAFNLDFSMLNSTLRRLGKYYSPINNKELHTRQFQAHLKHREIHYVEHLRSNFIGDFDSQNSLARYLRLRAELTALPPDPDWFESYDDLPDLVIEKYLLGWLQQQQLVTELPVHTPTLSKCREQNIHFLQSFALRYGKLVSAWLSSTREQVAQACRSLWQDPSAAKLGLSVLAQQRGWNDFRLLNDDLIVQWLTLDGAWPSGKQASQRPEDWGISLTAMHDAQEAAKQAREQQRRLRVQITFAGDSFSALTENYVELANALRARLSEATRLSSDSTESCLLADLPPSPVKTIPGAGGGGGNRPPPNTQMSEEQRKAIGFIGELWAFEWIKQHHLQKHGMELDENCWVSGYRDIMLATKNGDDSLGYDFVVRDKQTTYYYEVKASSGNPCRFELGPTELVAAQRYSADTKNKYRILYISNATDPGRVQPLLIDNPFSSRGRKKLRIVGRGSVTYAFELRD